ncbi:MAG: hypothetical protein ABJD11_03695 [Gemmatimonadota bacterium]
MADWPFPRFTGCWRWPSGIRFGSGLIYAMNPCCVSFVGELAPTGAGWAEVAGERSWRVPQAAFHTRLLIAMSTALSPEPGAPRGYGTLPYEPDGSGRRQAHWEVFAGWRAELPTGLVDSLRGSTQRG